MRRQADEPARLIHVVSLNRVKGRPTLLRALAQIGQEPQAFLVDIVGEVSSRHEAGPVAVLESAAVGVPTVGTAVGHVVEWAPEAALAVPVGDAQSLAAALRQMLTDEAFRLRLARAALDLACGSGRYARLLAEGRAAMVLALEIIQGGHGRAVFSRGARRRIDIRHIAVDQDGAKAAVVRADAPQKTGPRQRYCRRGHHRRTP